MRSTLMPANAIDTRKKSTAIWRRLLAQIDHDAASGIIEAAEKHERVVQLFERR